MIGSRVKTILTPFFQKFKNFKRRHVGCLPEAIDWNIALRTQIFFWVGVSEVRFQKKHFQSKKPSKLAKFPKVFLGSNFRYARTNKNQSAQRNIPVYCLWKTPHMPTFDFFLIFEKRLKMVVIF